MDNIIKGSKIIELPPYCILKDGWVGGAKLCKYDLTYQSKQNCKTLVSSKSGFLTFWSEI